MNRTELIIATAIVLFAAFLLGWFASWLVHRLTRVSRGDLGEMDRMARQLLEAEQARDRAVQELARREAELAARISAAEAETEAAVHTLRESRTEVEELRDYIERRLARERPPEG